MSSTSIPSNTINTKVKGHKGHSGQTWLQGMDPNAETGKRNVNFNKLRISFYSVP